MASFLSYKLLFASCFEMGKSVFHSIGTVKRFRHCRAFQEELDLQFMSRTPPSVSSPSPVSLASREAAPDTAPLPPPPPRPRLRFRRRLDRLIVLETHRFFNIPLHFEILLIGLLNFVFVKEGKLAQSTHKQPPNLSLAPSRLHITLLDL